MTSTYEIGTKYVALVKEGRREECLSTLFSPDAVSVEAAEFPGRQRTVQGLDGLRAKSKFFLDNNEVHKSEVFGPYPNDDRFAVRFVFEVTFKPTGQRRAIDEIGLFTVADGKITREEFFYPVT
jgi:SnoaL-like domain